MSHVRSEVGLVSIWVLVALDIVVASVSCVLICWSYDQLQEHRLRPDASLEDLFEAPSLTPEPVVAPAHAAHVDTWAYSADPSIPEAV
jgi:hypothetical protein